MRYRLIAFDLDGTLLNRNKQILPESHRYPSDAGHGLPNNACHRSLSS